jgi:hypothetical protein
MKHKCFVLALIILAIVAVISNPSQNKHQKAVEVKVISYMQELAAQNNANGLGTLGLMFGKAIVGQVIKQTVTSDNYVLFSLTKIKWQGKSKVIGIGMFLNVFLFMTNDALKDAMSEIKIK